MQQTFMFKSNQKFIYILFNSFYKLQKNLSILYMLKEPLEMNEGRSKDIELLPLDTLA
jgi:hypothetical protein